MLFTVFTATYNRAHTLHRVYESLCAQTCRDFEWIVIDDGSNDDTQKLLEAWKVTANFPMRAILQPHVGKHIAYNHALKIARGEFFIPLDSDDAMPANSLERMAWHWQQIPDRDKPSYSGVAGLCADPEGKIIGDLHRRGDSTLRTRHFVHKIRGEHFGSLRTDIARRYPFPEVVLDSYLPDGIVWLEIAKTYKDRCVNEVFRYYYTSPDSVGLVGVTSGKLMYYRYMLSNHWQYCAIAPLRFGRAALLVMFGPLVLYWRNSKKAGQSPAGRGAIKTKFARD
jgi:glycosyltransferase involved in cell wall biosynthesis